MGKTTHYPQHYDPGLLFPIPRQAQRQALGISAGRLPFVGADFWTAFEVSWLNPRGKPQVGIAHFTFPCGTPNIIESKSFKLYLGSYNQSRFENLEAVRNQLRQDLTEAAWRGSDAVSESIGVRLLEPGQFDAEAIAELDGINLDRLDVECTHYEPAPHLLRTAEDATLVEETLCSRLLRSNCPVTQQPDWGSIQISYTGAAIDQAALLQYLVSYRNHNGFHEHCVEQIFTDIWLRCKPLQLSVYARYTRRGGLDINPLRSSHPQRMPAQVRTARQ